MSWKRESPLGVKISVKKSEGLTLANGKVTVTPNFHAASLRVSQSLVKNFVREQARNITGSSRQAHARLRPATRRKRRCIRHIVRASNGGGASRHRVWDLHGQPVDMLGPIEEPMQDALEPFGIRVMSLAAWRLVEHAEQAVHHVQFVVAGSREIDLMTDALARQFVLKCLGVLADVL